MEDDRRKRDDLGSAPTTPSPERTLPNPVAEPSQRGPIAQGSGPDSTLEVPAGDVVAASDELGPGAAIGHFIVRRRLGEGGMGVVLACEDADLGRAVALKLVRTDTEHPAYRARLLREAQAMARLEHPNVVKVYEVGSDHGRLFIAMELVDGQTLSAWLRESRGWRELLDIFIQVGEGLAAAHAAGLVHRDFKPDNVLVDRSSRARVADFGLARIDVGEAKPLTKTGALMGTPGYMAPEQQFGADVDARADQYSFCVAMREALGGRPLDDARWAMVPRDVRNAIARGLSYDAAERFASMQELLAELRSVKVPVTEPRWIIALLVLVVVGTVSGIVVYFNSKAEPTRQQLAITRDATPAVVEPEHADAGRDDRAIVEAPPPPATSIDAGVLATVARDAGVARARDAGVKVAGAPRAAPADAAVAAAGPVAVTAGSAAGPPQLNVIRPTSKGLPESKVGHPGHLPIVRNAIKNLGYDGFDPKRSADALEKEIEATSGSDQGIAKAKLGQLKRSKGDCPVANALWDDAIKVLEFNGTDDEKLWNARAWIGRSLCALAAGKADDAFDFVTRAWVNGNRDEVQLLMGFIKLEQGDKDLAYASLLVSERSKDPKVQAALKAWLDGMGFTLR
ncbi:MAG TPA: serine/threonine-protein kinase [Kofleriaceae bacterium]